MSGMRIAEVRVGTPRPFGPKGELSAIDKEPVAGPVQATRTGLAGDVQGDPLRHGGPDKAIHAYPMAHYPVWAIERPDIAARLYPGAFGENLVVEDCTEADICLGDQWRIGGALLEVSQGRQPCWKLNTRFDRPDMARCVQTTGRAGWYFRVLEPGAIAAGDRAAMVARTNPDWPLPRVTRLLYHEVMDRDALMALAGLPGLPESWRTLALRRLATGAVEDWQPRLETPS